MCSSLFPHPLYYYWYEVVMLKVLEADIGNTVELFAAKNHSLACTSPWMV